MPWQRKPPRRKPRRSRRREPARGAPARKAEAILVSEADDPEAGRPLFRAPRARGRPTGRWPSDSDGGAGAASRPSKTLRHCVRRVGEAAPFSDPCGRRPAVRTDKPLNRRPPSKIKLHWFPRLSDLLAANVDGSTWEALQYWRQISVLGPCATHVWSCRYALFGRC